MPPSTVLVSRQDHFSNKSFSIDKNEGLIVFSTMDVVDKVRKKNDKIIDVIDVEKTRELRAEIEKYLIVMPEYSSKRDKTLSDYGKYIKPLRDDPNFIPKFSISPSGTYPNEMTIITGLPGTGKTYLLRKILHQIDEKFGLKIMILDRHDQFVNDEWFGDKINVSPDEQDNADIFFRPYQEITEPTKLIVYKVKCIIKKENTMMDLTFTEFGELLAQKIIYEDKHVIISLPLNFFRVTGKEKQDREIYQQFAASICAGMISISQQNYKNLIKKNEKPKTFYVAFDEMKLFTGKGSVAAQMIVEMPEEGRKFGLRFIGTAQKYNAHHIIPEFFEHTTAWFIAGTSNPDVPSELPNLVKLEGDPDNMKRYVKNTIGKISYEKDSRGLPKMDKTGIEKKIPGQFYYFRGFPLGVVVIKK